MVKQKSLRQLARELGVSAAYLSQVKNGRVKPSARLLRLLSEHAADSHSVLTSNPLMGTSSVHGGFDTHSLPPTDELDQESTESFLEFRRDGLPPETLKFYQGYLRRSASVTGPSVTGHQIKRFPRLPTVQHGWLNTIPMAEASGASIAGR